MNNVYTTLDDQESKIFKWIKLIRYKLRTSAVF